MDSENFIVAVKDILTQLECGNLSIGEAKTMMERYNQPIRKRGRPRKTTSADSKLPKRSRGRPKDTCRKKIIIVLWAYFTMGIPNAGAYKKLAIRTKLEEFMAVYFEYQDTSIIRRYTRIWNQFYKSDIQTIFQILYIHTDDNNPIGSRIKSLDDIIHEDGSINLDVLGLFAQMALSKYDKK